MDQLTAAAWRREVLRYTSNANIARTLTFSGLAPGKNYSLELYASRNNTGNATTFSAAGKSVTVLTDKNLTSKAFLGRLSPNASGQLVLNIANVNAYNYLNGFVLVEGAPAANAGSDKNITLPENSVVLTGSGTDEDGSIASYSWSKTSGPSGFTIHSPSSASTTVSNLTEGSYTFRLTVTDNSGAIDIDEVQVVVSGGAPTTGAKSIKVNLYGGTNPYNNTGWNNWNVVGSLNSGALKYSDATSSSVSAALSSSGGVNDNGTAYGSGMAPAEVLRYTSNATTSRTLTLSGLSTSKTYSLELYGSRNNYSGNYTVFTVNGTSQNISTYRNLTQKAQFTNLAPNASGQITVTIDKQPNL